MDKKTKKVLATLAITTMAVMPTTIAIVRTVEHQPSVANAFSQSNISSYSQEESYENVSLYDDILFDNSDVKVVNEVKNSTNRGTAADRFFGSAYDKVGAESESDLEKDEYTPSQDLEDVLDELEKGDTPAALDPTINPETNENLDGINNISEDDLTGLSTEGNTATAHGILTAAGVLAGLVLIVGGVHLRRRLDGERVRKLGTRAIQDKYFIKNAEKLSDLDKKIAKKEANGSTISTSFQQKRDKAALKVAESSLTTVDGINPKRLSRYGFYAKWRRYGGYISNSLNSHGYRQLCEGLMEYGYYLDGDVTTKSAQSHLKKAVSCFNAVAGQIENDVYFGEWSISNDSAGLNKQVKLSTIPIFPFRYVQNQGLEITIEQKADLENFFNDVFAEKAHNEKDVTYGTISYYRENSETPNQMKYAFDNEQGAKLIKSKLLTLVPQDATKIVVEETNKAAKKSSAKTTTVSYNTQPKIKAAKERAEQAIAVFNKTYELTNSQKESKNDGIEME